MRKDHPGWPVGLDDLGRGAPDRLWVLGADAAAAPGGWVAVVGTRSADPVALRAGREIAQCAVDEGCGVISGGAMGVDAAAHAGAVEAGGVTVAVLAGGLDRPSPARNRRLFEAMVDAGGGLWTEAAPGSTVYRRSFPQRNRLIAAAASLVVVVQARERSGSMSTAAHASRLGRPLAVVPGGWRDSSRGGCAALLRRGASPVTGPGDLARLLGVAPGRVAAGPTGDAARVLDLLRAGASGAEELGRATGWEVGRCLAAVTELEVGGWWGA